MNEVIYSRWLPVLLLVGSNVFMTFAWYGHLNFKDKPLWLVMLASWGIAFFEYCLMVPANRWGNVKFSTAELKIIQEVITITVFTGFLILYRKEKLQWNNIAALACIIAAVIFTFLPQNLSSKPLTAKLSQAEKETVTTP
jgi:uncharacterized protein